MATRFLRYDSDPILRKKCKAVLKVDDKIRQLLDDMLDTLHETENGAALAANQVGVLKRLVVIAARICRSCDPALFCRDSLMMFIPWINRARAPNILQKISR